MIEAGPTDLFRAAHTDLPREAPGSDATTRPLLEPAGPLPSRPRVVDIGCGAGADYGYTGHVLRPRG